MTFAPPSDGTSSIVLLIGELMRQSERYLSEGSHPRVLVEVRRGPAACAPGAKNAHGRGPEPAAAALAAGACSCASRQRQPLHSPA